jgi:hypothetical protein
MEKQTELTIRPYTHKELAVFYGVSWVTFRKWLRPYEIDIGPKTGHFYNSRQVEIIFLRLGYPKRPFLVIAPSRHRPNHDQLSLGI